MTIGLSADSCDVAAGVKTIIGIKFAYALEILADMCYKLQYWHL